jgi:hypothetical protein
MTPDEKLKSHIKVVWANLEDWGENPTSENGIMIVKFPISRTSQAFVGLKLKKYENSKKGVFLKSKKEVTAFRDLLNCKEMYDFFNDESLKKELLSKKEWDEIPSGIPGIGYTKIPNKLDPAGTPAIIVNPINESGKKMKRKNLFFQNIKDVTKYRELFNNQKIDHVMQIIDEINYELTVEFRIAQSKIIEKFK